MKRIHCTFYRPEAANTIEFSNIVGKLEWDFHLLCTGKIRSANVRAYICSLLRMAEPLERNPEMYFLGLDQPGNMPSDVRVDFFYRPTYVAAAFVIRAVLMYPELMDDGFIEDSRPYAKEAKTVIKDVLPGLMLGCTGRGFAGHGFDGLKGVIETLQIFAEAGAETFLRRYPELCPEFTKLYFSSMEMLKDRINTNSVCNEWGEKYSEEAEEVMETIRQLEGVF